MSALHPAPHTLDTSYPLKWSSSKPSACKDLPFTTADIGLEETAEHHVVRNYLQFLWLPESIMTLNLLVPSLLRVQPPPNPSTSSAAQPHPLYQHLAPLLLTPRSVTNKYYTEVPQILDDGGGAGDVEESMMWFAVNNERFDDDEEEGGEGEGRKRWLERMERRETQIQILIHLLLLTLPPPPPPPPPTKKRKCKQPPISTSPSHPFSLSDSPSKPKSKTHIPSKDDHGRESDPTHISHAILSDKLETFMDRLSTWQLLSKLDFDSDGRARDSAKTQGKGKEKQKVKGEERDWMQVFCEDIVEPLFKEKLPDQTSLLHSKLFPHSPFSDSSPSHSRSSSPTTTTRSRSSSPHPHTLPPRARGTSVSSSRSRSLSVSLMDEQRERNVGVGAGAGKRVMSREVSMSRVFKTKGVGRTSSSSGLVKTTGLGRTASSNGFARTTSSSGFSRTSSSSRLARTASSSTLGPGRAPGVTRERKGSVNGSGFGDGMDGGPGVGVTLVAATPTKPKPKPSTRPPQRSSSSQPTQPTRASRPGTSHLVKTEEVSEEDDDELLLGSSGYGRGLSDFDEEWDFGLSSGGGGGEVLVQGSPCKKGKVQ
ncbi:hypothetical protein JAAARDRAFT_191643 [Jaapia argillacea MUCL 33604]|uniref:DNA replication regulator Sld3 C-terminal domain-containing protein n=1 Tax=Jaapia argillacea MUCL 33604 TaxID=933084 RepID=A0A067PZJ2_9AGAM|nr:hypothetical protein JAAARDRAFT_191643 [Jaapia argillacea MUCL 33604]